MFLLESRSSLNFSFFLVEMQSPRNQHLLDSTDEHRVYANVAQRDVAPHQVPEGMNSEWVIL